eukprot:125829_1
MVGYITSSFRAGLFGLNYKLYRYLKIIILILPLLNLFQIVSNSRYNSIFVVTNVIYIILFCFMQWQFNKYIRKVIVRKILHDSPVSLLQLNDPCNHNICQLLRDVDIVNSDDELFDPNSQKHQNISDLNPLLFGLMVKHSTLGFWCILSLIMLTVMIILYLYQVVVIDAVVIMLSIDSFFNILCLLMKFQYFGTYYAKCCNNKWFKCDYLCALFYDTTPAKQQNEENDYDTRQLQIKLKDGEDDNKKEKWNEFIHDSVFGLDLIVHGFINDCWKSNKFKDARLPSDGVISVVKLYTKQCVADIQYLESLYAPITLVN